LIFLRIPVAIEECFNDCRAGIVKTPRLPWLSARSDWKVPPPRWMPARSTGLISPSASKASPNTRVSLDLLNKPWDIKEDTCVRIVKRLVEAIRAEDPDPLTIAEGLSWGNKPVPGLAGLKFIRHSGFSVKNHPKPKWWCRPKTPSTL